MKRYLILMGVALMFTACGGSGGGGGRGSEGELVGPNTVSTGSETPLGDIANIVTSATPSNGADADSPNRAAPAADTRFDEHGNIKGVYGVPYVPAKKKQGNP